MAHYKDNKNMDDRPAGGSTGGGSGGTQGGSSDGKKGRTGGSDSLPDNS